MKKRKHKPHKKHVNTKPIALAKRYRPGFLSQMDQRSRVYTALKETFDEIVADKGGLENLSAIQRSMIERFCHLKFCVQCLEQRMAARVGETGNIDKDELSKLTLAINSMNGLGKQLGYKREAKQVLNLQSYIKSK